MKINSETYSVLIPMKGSVLMCPDDWVILEDALEKPEEAERAMVIEIRNHQKEGIPHIVFFANKTGAEITDYEAEKIYACCAKKIPGFGKILEEDKKLPRGKSRIGMFMIVSTSDPQYSLYNENNKPPYGCVVIRCF